MVTHLSAEQAFVGSNPIRASYLSFDEFYLLNFLSMEEELKTEKEERRRENAESVSRLEEEIKAGEWKNLKRFEAYRQRSRQGRIIATHKALSNRIKQLEYLFYQMVANNPKKSLKLLTEIKRLRFLLDYLLNALIWEERGEIEEHDVPEELEGSF